MFPFQKSDALEILRSEIAKRLIERSGLILMQPVKIVEITSKLTNHTKPTKQLQRRYSKAKILKVDNIFQQLPAHSVDLVFSNLMFYPRDELLTIFAEIKRILRPEGLLFFSILGPDTLHEFRESLTTTTKEPVTYPFIDMHDVGDMLTKAHFNDPVMDMEKLTFTYSKTSKLLPDLKNFIQHIYSITLTDQAQQQQITACYETFRDTQGLLPATIEVIYGHAWGSIEQIKNANETIIPLNSIKKMPNP